MDEKRILDKQHLLAAIKISMQQGGSYLVRRLVPNGPIMRGNHLSYIHKTLWGMYASGVDRDIIWRILDWVKENALQSNGDFFFPSESPSYKVFQRVYRPLTFGKVAVWVGHPLFKKEKVVNRILQYQHKSSGGVFNYIGEEPEYVEEQETIGSLNTSFFGHLMIALNMKEEAIKAGEWIRKLIEVNEINMLREGVMYTLMTPDGVLVTEVKRGKKITSLVNNKDPKQEFWQIGTCMAYLSVLYEAMREKWGHDERETEPYLDGALKLLEFEATMPLYTYFWPSKCKVGWGVGELLRILTKYGKGTKEQIEKAYQISANVAIFTFIDNQLPSGGWSCLHYPLEDEIPEMAFEYKPLKGMVNVPDKPIPGSKTVFISAEEMTGEFLGEMKSIEKGIRCGAPIFNTT